MASKGWIKLHRQLQYSPLWNDEKFTKGQAWVDLLLLANHEDNLVLVGKDVVRVKRGQHLTSILKLSNKWLWDRRTVSSYLNMKLIFTLSQCYSKLHNMILILQNITVWLQMKKTY